MGNQKGKLGTGIELKYKVSVPLNLSKDEKVVAERYIYYVCVKRIMIEYAKTLLCSMILSGFMLYSVYNFYQSGITSGLQFYTAVIICGFSGFMVGINSAKILQLLIQGSRHRISSNLVVRKGKIHANNLNSIRPCANVVTESGEPYIADMAREFTRELFDGDSLPVKVNAYILESGKYVAVYPVQEFTKAVTWAKEIKEKRKSQTD